MGQCAPSHRPHPPLSDGVVALRGFELADVPAVVAACQDPAIPRRTLVPSPYGDGEARAYMRHMKAGRAAGGRLSLAVADGADSGVLLGSIALNPLDWQQRAADVGYWIAAAARGRGDATRAVQRLTARAFVRRGLERLELRAQEANHASQVVAARAGLQPVARPPVRRPECDHLPDVYFARLRGG
jgi:RimJ/RimL family protein N-acetyltransferase